MSLVRSLRNKAIELIVAAHPELHGYPYVVTNIEVPAVMAFPPDFVRAGDTFGGPTVFGGPDIDPGGATVNFTLRLYQSISQGPSDQDALDAYISPDGDKSLMQLFIANPTLDGICSSCVFVEARNYGPWPIGPVPYLGVEIVLEAKS